MGIWSKRVAYIVELPFPFPWIEEIVKWEEGIIGYEVEPAAKAGKIGIPGLRDGTVGLRLIFWIL